jgi:hypothetical protein
VLGSAGYIYSRRVPVQQTPSQNSREEGEREGEREGVGREMDVEKVTEVAPEVDDDGRLRTGITHATHLTPLPELWFSQFEFIGSCRRDMAGLVLAVLSPCTRSDVFRTSGPCVRKSRELGSRR